MEPDRLAPPAKGFGVEVLCVGELLADLVGPTRRSGSSPRKGELGGAPANVAAVLAQLGSSTALAAAVGDDPAGRRLQARLDECGVDTRLVRELQGTATSVADVALDRAGEPSFVFHREGRADHRLELTEDLRTAAATCRILHVGTFSLSMEPFRSTQLELTRLARQRGALITCDLNLRREVWPDLGEARTACKAVADLADIVKVTVDELAFLSAEEDIFAGANEVLFGATRLVAVTMGRHGCYFRTRLADGFVPSFGVQERNSVGCGDGFMAGFLYWMCRSTSGISSDSVPDLVEALSFANAVGALVATADSAVPRDVSAEAVEAVASGQHRSSYRRPKRLVLFDIDGTLLDSAETFKKWNAEAVFEATGCSPSILNHRFDGKTDPQNMRELALNVGLEPQKVGAVLPRILKAYERLVESADRIDVRPLRGVTRLLDYLSRRDDIVLGVLTGNLESVARIKLEAAGLARYFLLGAYGSDAPERLDLPRIAVERARTELGFRFSPAEVVIVGDTVYDVACASDFGAISVSVPGGVDSREALRAAGTTVLMKHAGDVVALQAAL